MKKQVVITGGSSGIGLAAARLATAAGHSVVLVARNAERLAAACKDLNCRGVQLDVGDGVACLALADEVDPASSEIVLVNNAGFANFGTFHEQPMDTFDDLIRSNLLGVANCCRALIPSMLTHGSGQIINVLSVSATTAFGGAVGYCAAKAGALMLTRCMALEYRRQGIRFTALNPGSTDTPLWDKQSRSLPRQEMLSAGAVGQAIVELIDLPPDRVVDEMSLMPPKGLL